MTQVTGAVRAAISETRVSFVWSFGKDLGLAHCVNPNSTSLKLALWGLLAQVRRKGKTTRRVSEPPVYLNAEGTSGFSAQARTPDVLLLGSLVP